MKSKLFSLKKFIVNNYRKYFIADLHFSKRSFKNIYKIKTNNLVKNNQLIEESMASGMIHTKWFKNISAMQMLENVQMMLSMGPRFNVNTTKDINI